LLSPKSHATHEGARDLADYGKKLQKSVRDSAASIPNADILLPLVSYYGTGRLWGEKRLTQGKKAETNLSRTAGYTDCLNSASKYKIFADWFERLCRSEFEERDNPKALGEITAMLAAVRNAVNSMLEPSGWSNIAFKSAQDGIVAEHPRFGLMSVDWLSDGIRNMIAMVADIAHRAVRLNSHLGENAAKETPGIVLIDEVDMHLHPEWQQSVISSLRQAFPRIQFIVTTHSPQVLSTVRREQIRLLLENGEVENLADDIGTYGAESSFILQEVLEVDSRPQSIETVGKLKKYQKLVEDRREDTDEGRNLRQELEASLGKHDRALLTADIRISQLKILRPS
jgi:predicted ATP-binding protein involved in virulence